MVKCVTMTSTGIAMESDLVGMTYQRVGVDWGLALTCPRAKSGEGASWSCCALVDGYVTSVAGAY